MINVEKIHTAHCRMACANTMGLPSIFRKGARGNGRVGKEWSGREQVGTGTRIPSVFRSQLRLPDPFPSLVSVPTVYRPAVRHLVPVPTVSRPAVRCIPDSSSAQLPSRRSHTVSPIPKLTIVADVLVPFTIGCILFPSYDNGFNWVTQLWMQQLQQ